MRSLLWRCLALTVLLVLGACGEEPSPSESAEFGFNECDRFSDLCWQTKDATRMSQILGAQDALWMAATSRAPQEEIKKLADALTSKTLKLRHKLNARELETLLRLHRQGRRIDAEGTAEFLQEFSEVVLQRPSGLYYATFSVPMAAQNQAAISGGKPAVSVVEAPVPVELSEGMQESLQALRDSGITGQVHAYLFEVTGVLERPLAPFEIRNRQAPYSIPREQIIAQMIEEAGDRSRHAGYIAGLESLIPVVGVAVSMTHENIMLFRIRARLALQIAAAYGIDVREGLNLFHIVTAYLGASAIPEVIAETGAMTATPIIIKIVNKRIGGAAIITLRNAAKIRQLARVIRPLSSRSAAILRRAAVKSAAKGAGKQAIGYATLGLTIIAQALYVAEVTDSMGIHLQHALRPWAAGMMDDAANYLGEVPARTCASRAMGHIMLADGKVSEPERKLLAVVLDRPFWGKSPSMKETWVRSSAALQRSLAETAARADSSEELARLGSCFKAQFYDRSEAERMSVLSHLFTMAMIDGALNPEEEKRFQDLAAMITEAKLFGPDGIPEQYLTIMRDTVRILLSEPEEALGEEDAAVVADFTATDVLKYLQQARPEADAIVNCAFDAASCEE